ncbi:MAG TPA: AAA family ATPase [Acidimicrobiia bacterium]
MSRCDIRDGAARITSPVLVGRARELSTLERVYERSLGGTPGGIVIGGEAGVGKTRLVADFCAGAEARGARVVTGRCVPATEGLVPFAPVVDAVRAIVDAADLHVDFDTSGCLLPTAVRALGDAILGATSGGGSLSAAYAPVFELVVSFLRRLIALESVVLVIEDMHWADASTRDLLAYVLGAVQHGRLVVVATYRNDEMPSTRLLRPWLAELHRAGAERIDLAGLSRVDVEAQIVGILGDAPSACLADEVFTRGQGNPFFTEELVAARGEPGTLPAVLREALLARMARLDEGHRLLLGLAAAAGRRVSHDVLAAAARRPESELLVLLREAIEAQILTVDPDDDTYAFRHSLMQEVVYGELLPGERAMLHRALAEALSLAPGAGSDLASRAELAHHWYAAHEWDRALEASVAAALLAENAGALNEAEQLFERAITLWARVPQPALELDLVDLYQHTAEAAHRSGHDAHALELITTARDLDPERVLRTVLFTDIVASTERAAELGDQRWRAVLDDHDDSIQRVVSEHRGRMVKSTGDGVMAVFDGPGSAVRAAQAAVSELRGRGTLIRAGLHTGEVELRGDDISGIAVHIAAHVCALAPPGEVLATRTIKDLVTGSDIAFTDHGTHALKGIPDEWDLVAVSA